MSLSIFGLVVMAVCGYLILTRGPLSLLSAVMLFTLFGGAAAVILTALGDSSVRPALLAIVLLSAASCAPGRNRAALMPAAVISNFPLVVYSLYGAATAFVLPYLFAGELQVVPLDPRGLISKFDTVPLAFTNQNITTAFYLLATMMAALSAWIAVQHKAAPRVLVMTIVAIGVFHAGFGLADLALTGTPLEPVLSFFRNANYAQHNQGINGFIRVNGIFPEPSVYATYALIWFVCCFELWLRDVRPRATGATAALLLVMLFLSWSSTAILCLGAYAAIFTLRAITQPALLRAKLVLTAGAGGFLFVLSGLTLALVKPEAAQAITDTFLTLTMEKSESDSGEQRLFWAMQGVDVFVSTFGLGIGAGSFRSSSLITAIMGSTGLIGLVTFAWFVVSTLKPFNLSTYLPNDDPRVNVGAALAWGTVGVLLPAAVTGASADPGVIFGILSGASLGLRGAMNDFSYPSAAYRAPAFAAGGGR